MIRIAGDRAFVRGNKVAVEWTTHGIGENKKPLAFEGIDVFEFDAESKITTLQAYWDPSKFMAQRG
jgi:hypothetical protein